MNKLRQQAKDALLRLHSDGLIRWEVICREPNDEPWFMGKGPDGFSVTVWNWGWAGLGFGGHYQCQIEILEYKISFFTSFLFRKKSRNFKRFLESAKYVQVKAQRDAFDYLMKINAA